MSDFAKDINVPANDCISRQAAIDALEREKSLVERPITETRWFDFGLRKAQDVLSELPSAQAEPCGDVPDNNVGECEDALGRAENAIGNLPSAQPETPPYVAEIESEYKKWASMPHINKPLAKALYEVWKKHDREDVSRNG